MKYKDVIALVDHYGRPITITEFLYKSSEMAKSIFENRGLPVDLLKRIPQDTLGLEIKIMVSGVLPETHPARLESRWSLAVLSFEGEAMVFAFHSASGSGLTIHSRVRVVNAYKYACWRNHVYRAIAAHYESKSKTQTCLEPSTPDRDRELCGWRTPGVDLEKLHEELQAEQTTEWKELRRLTRRRVKWAALVLGYYARQNEIGHNEFVNKTAETWRRLADRYNDIPVSSHLKNLEKLWDTVLTRPILRKALIEEGVFEAETKPYAME